MPPLVEIGLTDLTKSVGEGGTSPPGPPACDGPVMYMRMIVMSVMIDIYQNVDKYWNEPQNYLNYSFLSM